MAKSSFNGIHSNDFTYFEEVNTIVQEEPAEAAGPRARRSARRDRHRQGNPFAPDEHQREILGEAARIGAGLARTLLYKPRDKAAYIYPDGSWKTAFVGGSHGFLVDRVRLLDCRTMMHYVGTGITPAMTHVPSASARSTRIPPRTPPVPRWTAARTYTLTLPAGIPAKTFWAIDIYDTQTRALLQTDNPYPSINNRFTEVHEEANGDTILTFAPTAPANPGSNWLQTIPGKSWFPILRLYGPLEPWFDQTWRLGEIQPT